MGDSTPNTLSRPDYFGWSEMDRLWQVLQSVKIPTSLDLLSAFAGINYYALDDSQKSLIHALIEPHACENENGDTKYYIEGRGTCFGYTLISEYLLRGLQLHKSEQYDRL